MPIILKRQKVSEKIIGKKFNHLLVINYIPGGKSNTGRQILARAICKCDCGNNKIVALADLKRNHVKSCGCLRSETSKERMTTHGKSLTPEFSVWQGIKKRCYNKNESRYKDYGGRGIQICRRWKDSFVNFLDDIGERPSKNHSIERINNDGDYTKGNCRWATLKEQSSNKRPRHDKCQMILNKCLKCAKEFLFSSISLRKYCSQECYRKLRCSNRDSKGKFV